MARCPYLEYQGSAGFFEENEYICKLCYQHMYESDSRLKYTCKTDYGENYRNCPVYKNA